MSLQKELLKLTNENKIRISEKERELAEAFFKNELKPKMLEAAKEGKTYFEYLVNKDILNEFLMDILKSEHIGVLKERPPFSSYRFTFKWDKVYYEDFDE